MKKIFFLIVICLSSCFKDPKMVKTSVELFVFDEISKEPLDSVRIRVSNVWGGGGGMGLFNSASSSPRNPFSHEEMTSNTGKFKVEFLAAEGSTDYSWTAKLWKSFPSEEHGRGDKIITGESNKIDVALKTPAHFHTEIFKNNSLPKIDSFKFYSSNQGKNLVWGWHSPDTLAFSADNSGKLIMTTNYIVFYNTLTIFHNQRVQGNTFVKQTWGFKQNGKWTMKSDSIFCKMFTSKIDTIFY